MIAKHQTPQYKRNARIIRNRVRAVHARGESVTCWRCGRAITPGQPFDAGHRTGAVGSALTDLAPEHRHATPYCEGNRANGGAIAASISHARRAPTGGATTWKL